MGHQKRAGRAVFLDVAGGGNVIGGHAVGHHHQHPRGLDRFHRNRVGRHLSEERRLLDIGAGFVEAEQLAAMHGDLVPLLVLGAHVFVLLAELVGVHAAGDGGADFGLGGPNLFEHHRLAVGAGAERLFRQVDVHRAGQGVGHHQRRAGQVVGFDVRADAAFEVAVAAEHRRHHQVLRSTSAAMASGSGPLLPMQVMQP